MKIIFFGTGSFGLPSLEALKNSSHTLAAVVTAKDKPKGRQLKSQPTPIKEWALANHIPVIEYENIKSEILSTELKTHFADIFVVISFGAILPKNLLALPGKMALNVHSSLLPKYRGAAPIHWAILNDDARTGVTVMRLNERLDEGDVLLKESTAILPDDEIASLDRKLSHLGADLLMKALDLIASGKPAFEAQDLSNSFYARKITKEDGRILWDNPARRIWNQVRALHVWPGAYFFYKQKRFLIHEAAFMESASDVLPGTVLLADEQQGIHVQCQNGALNILSIQMEGKKPLPVSEFLRGFSFLANDRLE